MCYNLRRLISIRRLRRPKCLIVLGGLFFLMMGTFYWSLWEIPSWIPIMKGKDDSQEGGSDMESYSNQGSHGFFPEPLNCIHDTVLAKPFNGYCVWNNTATGSTDCQSKMMPRLKSKSSYVFLGDQHMAKLAQAVSVNWPFENEPLNTTTTRRHPCQNLAYYGLPPPHDGKWIPPDSTGKGEGPVAYGKDHPYCQDCRKCWNILMETYQQPSQDDDDNHDVKYLEYLVVEYSRDVTTPTLVTNTTQETASYYLSRRAQRPSVCIASAGLNDAAIVPTPSLDTYIKNADRYLGLLQRTCDSVVWISIHSVVENSSIPQKNCNLQTWNNAVFGQVSMRNYSNVYYVDIWDTSLNTNHEGFLALEKSFYQDLSKLFTNLMQG